MLTSDLERGFVVHAAATVDTRLRSAGMAVSCLVEVGWGGVDALICLLM